MRTILCFGDSNTWGYDPSATSISPFPIRYAPEVRWTGVLARELGAGFRIIEEGQNGRTTVHDDPTAWASRSVRAHLPVVLESHKPIDIVVLMLGTNDLKTFFNVPPQDIANGAGVLVRVIQTSQAGRDGAGPQVLLLAPPPIAALDEYAEMFEDAADKSQKLSGHYQQVAKGLGCAFLDTSKVIVSSPEVSKPVAVRYAWQDWPECNLTNGAGLPASPFRTDTWKGVTEGKNN